LQIESFPTRIKVCDFGLSRLIFAKDEKLATFGSPAYAAPELPTSTHTFPVDVWSFGIM
jgi:serine/threonine protein kinase